MHTCVSLLANTDTDESEREKLKTWKYDKNLATPFKPAEKYGIASTAFAAIMATESEGVTKNLANKG